MSALESLPKSIPFIGDDYEGYLDSAGLLDGGFRYGELVSHTRHNKMEPPEDLWHRMVPTLLLAIQLRAQMIELGAHGLRINAAYRPDGGARLSQHKRNAALDIDLLDEDRPMGVKFYAAAAKLWSDYGTDYQMGLGFYGPQAKRFGGIRVHIDTGWKSRCWWGNPSIGPLPAEICRENGWPVPSRRSS